jgi:hypothetical protein
MSDPNMIILQSLPLSLTIPGLLASPSIGNVGIAIVLSLSDLSDPALIADICLGINEKGQMIEHSVHVSL